MEDVENPMILPELLYRSQTEYEAECEAMAEKSDRKWEDYYGED